MAETTPGSYESCPDGQRRFCSSIHGKGHTEGLQDLKGWVLGSSPINGVPTSPKVRDPR